MSHSLAYTMIKTKAELTRTSTCLLKSLKRKYLENILVLTDLTTSSCTFMEQKSSATIPTESMAFIFADSSTTFCNKLALIFSWSKTRSYILISTTIWTWWLRMETVWKGTTYWFQLTTSSTCALIVVIFLTIATLKIRMTT